MPEASRVGDDASCPADAHGCTTCPHSVKGPAEAGSHDVQINDRAALMVSATGTHSSCCGSNSWAVATGSSTVFINDKPASRKGDVTQHCGGAGQLIAGSTDVFIGDAPNPEKRHWIEFVFRDKAGGRVAGVRCYVKLPGDVEVLAVTDEEGIIRFEGLNPGQAELRVPDFMLSS